MMRAGGVLRVVDKKEADLSHAVQLRRGPSKGRHAKFNRENEHQYRLTVRSASSPSSASSAMLP